jgi:hypothetical protein
MNDPIFSKILHEDNEKCFQWRVTVSEFRGVQYFGVRKYFLSFEGTWEPTKEGATIPLTIDGTLRLFLAISDLLSEAEISLVDSSLQQIIKEYKNAETF